MKYLIFIAALMLTLISCSGIPKDSLIIKESPHNVEITYNRLKAIIQDNPNLKILLELDHSKNAASVDLTLEPTKIILFGNPKLGTPLMQESATTSIDLPQKIIVYADVSGTKIAYNNPMYLKQRHGIQGAEAILEKISKALQQITDKAIGPE